MIIDTKLTGKFKPGWNVPKGYRYCYKCKKVKSLEVFVGKTVKDNLCRDCEKIRSAKKRLDPVYREKRNEYLREYRAYNPEKNTTNWVIKKYGSYAAYNEYRKHKSPSERTHE